MTKRALHIYRGLEWYNRASEKDRQKAFAYLLGHAIDSEDVSTWSPEEQEGKFTAPYIRSCGEPINE